MKTLRVNLLFLIPLFLLCCTKEYDSCKSNIDNLNLYQTFWEGTIIYKESGQEQSFQIKVFFDFNNHGEYSIAGLSPQLPYSEKSIFTYSVDNKMLLIEGGYNNILSGNWFITGKDKDKLVLQHNIIDEVNNSKLVLIKKY